MSVRRVIPFLCALLVYVGTQEILQDFLGGSQRSMRKQTRAVPRYYICGAGTWIKRQATPPGQRCQRRMERRSQRKSQRRCKKIWKWKYSCRDHWYDQPYDHWYDYCYPIPEVHHWTRINGLRFQYCHYQDWNNQFYLQEGGNYNWLGMKMCPPGMYVYGMRTKLSERDGLAGFILLCRNMKNPSSIAEVLIFDGEGGWRGAVGSGNYVVGFKTIMRQPWIYGLKFQMAAIPLITTINLKYSFPNIIAAPVLIDKVVIVNSGSTAIMKQVQLTKKKQFIRSWSNQNGYLHLQALNELFSPSLKTSASIDQPYITPTIINGQQTYVGRTRKIGNIQNFVFGRNEAIQIGQYYKEVVKVPPLTNYIIIQSVPVANIDIPYTLDLTFSNGFAVENERISGVYKGASIGEVQNTVSMTNI